MKITKARLKQIIKEEIESITNEARAPRSALAFANQVHETLNSAKPPYSFSGSVKRAGTYDTMRTGYGKFLRKDYFDDGDKPEISTLLYDLRVFPKKREYLPEPWSSSDLDTSEATLEAVKEILQDAYGPIKKMNMRGVRRIADAIPVGKYAIVFDMRGTMLGISKILQRLKIS